MCIRDRNDGDTVTLIDQFGQTVDVVSYSDGFQGSDDLWPQGADAEGSTLELINPDLDNSVPQSWQASFVVPGGTPGYQNSVEPEGFATVQVIHNSASPTVDVYVDGGLAISGFEYRTATGLLELPTSFTVGIAPAGGDVIAEFPFELAEGGSYVVVATGLLGNDVTPFTLAATATTFGASSSDVVGLEVYHGSTDAPAVDIWADDSPLLTNFSYGDFSGFVEVPAADYTLGVAPAGGDIIAAFTAPLSGLGGGSAVAFASGFLSGDDPAFGLFAALNDGTVLALPALEQDCAGVWGGDAVVDECDVCNGDGIADGSCDCDGNVEDCAGDCGGSAELDECGVCGGDGSTCNESTATVQVIHNSASPTVDVYVDGGLAISGFEYRTATGLLELPTSFTVGIAPAGGDVIAEFPFELAEGGSYVVVATGLLGNDVTPFTLAATATTFGASSSDVVGLEVYHGSTDAPAVDIWADDSPLLTNFSYGDFSGFVEVPAADYTLGVAPAGGDIIAAFTAPLSGLGGGSAVAFASGFLSGDDPAFGLFAALNDGTVLALPALEQDCAGVWGGDAVVDECDVCNGDGIADGSCDCDGNVEDCAGDCGGSAELDECGVCGGDGIADGECDCDGSVDLGCGCGEAGPSGCDETCGSTLSDDECGVCGGDDSSCAEVTVSIDLTEGWNWFSVNAVSDDMGINLSLIHISEPTRPY